MTSSETTVKINYSVAMEHSGSFSEVYNKHIMANRYTYVPNANKLNVDELTELAADQLVDKFDGSDQKFTWATTASDINILGVVTPCGYLLIIRPVGRLKFTIVAYGEFCNPLRANASEKLWERFLGDLIGASAPKKISLE